MKFPGSKAKSGMIMIIVAGVLFFLTIIFTSLVSRVRHESTVTNRVSVNERLYQLASAVGRLTVRKLQKDFETNSPDDPDYGRRILKAAFADKTGIMDEIDYTSRIKALDVVKEIMTRFKKEWGNHGEVDFKVTYIVNLGDKFPFRAPIKGLEKNPYERNGYIEVIVKVSHLGIEKTCRIRKEFLLCNLMAPPFHRFTLFSHRGASIGTHHDESMINKLANQTFNKDDGKLDTTVSDGRRPLTCINRLVRKKRERIEGLDFRFNRADNIVKDIDGDPSFVKSGWIYLGGRGPSKDSKGDDGNLILNVLAGAHDDILKSAFGEYFHFYFNPNSAGWLISKDWTEWFNDKIPGNAQGEASKLMVAFVDYGYYKGVWDIKFRDLKLFNAAKYIYEQHLQKPDIRKIIDVGNSMHLFGTPAFCTPTLVFGKIKRRYLRTFAFYFGEISRVHPIPSFTRSDDLDAFITDTIPNWFSEMSGGSADDIFFNDFISAFLTNIDYRKFQIGFPDNSPSLCGLDPEVRDWEPYMSALHNISDPGGPDRKWTDAVPDNGYVDDDPEPLCVTDYQFVNDKEIHYSGGIRDIKPDSSYLRDRVSFRIPTEAGKPLYLSKSEFFNNHFITEEDRKKLLYLNQIIAIDGDLVIDMPLEVAKGGIIIASGHITVKEPIINKYILETPDNDDAFGMLTLIGDKGITINEGRSGLGELPQTHAMFISVNGDNGKVTVTKPLHIIGGVASDDLESLVTKGCVIEWGFEPEEFGGNKDLVTPGFYGLSMGPRDIEIITEE
ncbi:MAG: hypothetical protein GQF41_2810 [Candidatus Rifleibacterium amylolyticum]|nr:MAG: hypothetical protein GQF41_2810 [Candidatus Rifleibacterium amylolyticum]